MRPTPISGAVFASRENTRLAGQLGAARARIAQLETALARATSRDPISRQLLTLRTFRTQLELEVQRAERYGRDLTVAVLDIDRFRQFNLERGYGAGDRVLAGIGQVIVAGTRTNDLACRSGGDEFTIMFPETDAPGAGDAVRRILRSLENLEAGGVRGHSASAGSASLAPGQAPEGLIAAATTALEAARAIGGGHAETLAAGSDRATETEALAGAHGEVIAALASALGERDRYTGDHSGSVVDLAARVGESLALDPAQIGRLRTAALLHDIGKVGVPDEILHKPGPLDEREWEIMRQHPVIGERIIRAIPGMGAIARAVRHEHERWDGRGYPDGIAGERIPIEARIILACDAYHAMVSDRPYRKAMSHREAIAELTANAGSQFDPQVIEALVGYLYGRRQSGLATV
jgi:diguanylate cyclase (GGDEF)-like protein